MAVTVDSEMPTNTGVGVASAGSIPASPQTYSFTNTAGTLLCAIIGIGAPGAGNTAFGAVSYGGNAMTLLRERTPGGGATGGRVGLFYLVSPPTGSNTFSYAYTSDAASPNGEVWSGLTSFTGANLGAPFTQHTANGAGSGTTASANLTGVASATIAGAGAGTDMTTQTQTLTWAANVDGLSSLGNGRASRSTASGSVTHGFTISGSDSWAVVIAEIAAASAAAAPFRPVVTKLQAVGTASGW